MSQLVQTIVVGLSTGSAFALVAFGFVVIHQATGIVNFAQGLTAALGGIVSASLVSRGVPTILAIVIAIVLASVVSSIVGVVAIGRRGRTTPLASLIVTIGLTLLGSALVLLAFGDIAKTYPPITAHAWNIRGILVEPQYVLITGVMIAVAVGLGGLLHRTMIGQALLACADSRRAAEVIGLEVRTLGVFAFAVAGGIGALAGAMLVPVLPMAYDSDVNITVNGFAVAAVAGLASIRGAILGGLVLGVAENLVVGYWNPEYELAVALLAMVVLISWIARNEGHPA